MAVMAVMGLFLSLQRRRKPPAELVRGKSLRYRKRLLCYNESRSGNRSKSKGAPDTLQSYIEALFDSVQGNSASFERVIDPDNTSEEVRKR